MKTYGLICLVFGNESQTLSNTAATFESEQVDAYREKNTLTNSIYIRFSIIYRKQDSSCPRTLYFRRTIKKIYIEFGVGYRK